MANGTVTYVSGQKESEMEEEVEVSSVVSIRYFDIRTRILDTRRRIESDFIVFAEDLYAIWEGSNFLNWGHDSFRAYVEGELNIKYRRARYFVAIAKAVHDLELDWSDIEEIGWTKARALLPYLRSNGIVDGEELENWLEYAKEDSASELKTRMTDAYRTVGEANSSVEATSNTEIVSYSIQFSQEQASLFNDTMEHSKRMFDVDSNADALESLCYDWMMRAGTDVATLPMAEVVAWVEETYNVKLNVSQE